MGDWNRIWIILSIYELDLWHLFIYSWNLLWCWAWLLTWNVMSVAQNVVFVADIYWFWCNFVRNLSVLQLLHTALAVLKHICTVVAYENSIHSLINKLITKKEKMSRSVQVIWVCHFCCTMSIFYDNQFKWEEEHKRWCVYRRFIFACNSYGIWQSYK